MSMTSILLSSTAASRPKAGGGSGPSSVVILDDTFDANIAGWVNNSGVTSSWVATGGGRLRVYKSSSGYISAYRSFPTVVGKYYTVTATMAAAWNPGFVILANGSATYNSGGELGRPRNNTSSGTGSVTFAGTGNPVYIHALNASYTSTWIELDNIIVTEITPEEVFNYTFDTDINDWYAGTNATISRVSTGGGRIRAVCPSNGQGAHRNFDTIAGHKYILTGSLVGRSAWAYMRLETAAGSAIHTLIDSNGTVIDANHTFTGTGSPMRVSLYTYGSNWCEFDNISLKDLGADA